MIERVSTEAQTLLENAVNASKEKDIRQVLESLAHLTVITVIEENRSDSPENHYRGNPKKWKPGIWNGKVWFEGHNTPNTDDKPFFEFMNANFPPGTVTVVTVDDFVNVVIQHIDRHNCGAGTLPAHLLISKAKIF